MYMDDIVIQEHFVNLLSINFQRIWWFRGTGAEIRGGDASEESGSFFVSNLPQLRRRKVPNLQPPNLFCGHHAMTW